MMDPPTPVEAPPPAYEAEHDFDRKISDALERSLAISNEAPQRQPSSTPCGEDEWEEWDEARFEAAAVARARARERGQAAGQPLPPVSRRPSEKRLAQQGGAWQPGHSSGAGSSSTSAAQPSRRLPACPPAKERPSWYSEAQLDGRGSLESGQNIQVSSPPVVHHLPPEDVEPNEPLPPFAAVGPSLEGPPFEEVVRQAPRPPPAMNIDSPPESPLDSVEDSDSLPDPCPIAGSPGRRAYGENYRSASPHQPSAPPTPRTSPVPSSSPRPPPMRFDPSVAYSKHRSVNLSPTEAESREPVNASALYNSAVSSLFVPSQASRKPISMRTDTSASSGANRTVIRSVSQTHLGAPPNSHQPMLQNQAAAPHPHAPYSQLLPQQEVPSLYGHQFLSPTAGPSPATPAPPNWHPPAHNHGGGGGGRNRG